MNVAVCSERCAQKDRAIFPTCPSFVASDCSCSTSLKDFESKFTGSGSVQMFCSHVSKLMGSPSWRTSDTSCCESGHSLDGHKKFFWLKQMSLFLTVELLTYQSEQKYLISRGFWLSDSCSLQDFPWDQIQAHTCFARYILGLSLNSCGLNVNVLVFYFFPYSDNWLLFSLTLFSSEHVFFLNVGETCPRE